MKYYVSRSFLYGQFDIIIKDELGNDRYLLSNQGKVGYNYVLTDNSGTKYADIKQEISFRRCFTIITNEKNIRIEIKRPFKINGDPYGKFEGLDWSTEGNLPHHNYCVRDGINVVARVRLTGTEQLNMDNLFSAITSMANEMQRDLEIECNDIYDDPLALAVVIAIELAEESGR